MRSERTPVEEGDAVSIPFVPGLELSESLYWEGVRPVLDARFPGLAHAAARLEYGSDVLGFDTPQSMDHDWGPKLTLYLGEADHDRLAGEVDAALRSDLPRTIRGYPTHFSRHDDGTAVMRHAESGPIDTRSASTRCAPFLSTTSTMTRRARPRSSSG